MIDETRGGRWLRLGTDSWRADLLRIVQRIAVVLGGFLCIPTMWLALRADADVVAVIVVVGYLVLIGLTLTTHISVRWRAIGTCGVLYGIGTGLLVGVGSISQIHLFAFSMLTTLLLGWRAGLGAVVLSTATIAVAGAIGMAHPELGVSRWGFDLTGGALVTATFAVLDVALVVVLGAVLSALEHALRQALSSAEAVGQEHAAVLSSNKALSQELEVRAQREIELREQRAMLRIAGQIARIGGWHLDAVTGSVTWSDETRALHADAGNPDIHDASAIQFFLPAYRQTLIDAIHRCRDDGLSFDIEAEVMKPAHGAGWWRVLGVAEQDHSGAVTGVQGALQDITQQKTGEARHQKLEEQLLQAQKMEAIGSLAGGIAHDFNNLLSVILSYSELIITDLPAGNAAVDDLKEIIKAGERASKLTRQLLAFSRKQILQPVVLEFNPVVVGVQKMLVRLLGEDLKLTLLLDADTGKVFADEGQLEQVILNLVVNARDAMPDGGSVTIETASIDLDEEYAAGHAGVVAGPHVMLAVTDTGIGMDKATQARIFEPFFTTKDKSKGTGLGLSTVYGIVQQSGGHIWVYSEPGQGTTFKLYLPRTDRRVSPQVEAPPTPISLRGNETILLVEDEEQVRTVMCSVLRAHGYNVLEAQNGGEAFLLCEQFTATIHLLVTDVVMPRMSGRQLAERLRPLRPLMPVLYVSGYTENTIVHHGILDAGIEFLAKPIMPGPLLTRVRLVLDSRK